MIDYHIHPNYSIDAEGTIDEFCQMALRKGLDEIAFTTHVDTDPETEDCIVSVGGKMIDVRSHKWIENYEQAIRSAADRYEEEGLVVLMGAELDIYPEVANNLPESFLSTNWDLIIGSMHLIDHLAISKLEDARIIYSRYSLDELGELYYSILNDTVETSMVNVLGHIDLYRRYGESIYGEDIFDIWKPHIKSLASRMKKYNVGFEINTSSWRKGQTEPLPARDLMVALVENGVKTVTIGSDAHTPKDVGDRVIHARDLLFECCHIHPSTYRKGNVHKQYEE